MCISFIHSKALKLIPSMQLGSGQFGSSRSPNKLFRPLIVSAKSHCPKIVGAGRPPRRVTKSDQLNLGNSIEVGPKQTLSWRSMSLFHPSFFPRRGIDHRKDHLLSASVDGLLYFRSNLFSGTSRYHRPSSLRLHQGDRDWAASSGG